MLVKVHPHKSIKECNPDFDTIKAVIPGLAKLTGEQITILALTVDIENNPLSGIEKRKKAAIIHSAFGFSLNGVEMFMEQCFNNDTIIGTVADEYIRFQAYRMPEVYAYYVMSEKMVELSRDISQASARIVGAKSDDATYERIMQYQKDISTMAKNIREYRKMIADDIDSQIWEIVSDVVQQHNGSALRAASKK